MFRYKSKEPWSELHKHLYDKVAYHQTNNNNSVEVVGSGFWVLMSTLQGLCVHSVYPKAILLAVQYKANLGRVKMKG
jgi:hypothetical protein